MRNGENRYGARLDEGIKLEHLPIPY